MFDSKFNHEARFFADGYELSGVENVSFSYSASPSIVKPLGTKGGLTTHTGPIQQTMSMARVLSYNDPIFSYTGDNSLSGEIYYEDDSYNFKSGYLTDYSLNCAVGSVPRVSCNFQIVGEMVKSDQSIDQAPEAKVHPDIDIPTQGSISIQCENSSTNRVVGFDYGIKCKRKSYLTIGSNDIQKIELLPPLEYNATVQIDVDDAFLKDSYHFLENKEDKTVSISILGRNGNQVNALQIPNASLVSENLQVSADGGAKLTLNYIGHEAKEESSALSSRITYVFDENGDVYDSTPNSTLPYEWHREDANVYGLQVGANVKLIDGRSFYQATNLKGDLYINMGSGVSPDVSKIEFGAFKQCSGFDGSLIIEDGLQSIGYGAFQDSTLKGNLVFPNSIVEIGDFAFDGCKNFKGFLKLPTSDVTIKEKAFQDCSNLKGDLVIPDGVQDAVRDSTFKNCSGFDGNLYLGTGIKLLEKSAFESCTQLKGDLTMPPDLTGIRGSVFFNCNSLDGKLTLNEGLEYIGDSAFAQCVQISQDITVPDSVVGIGNFAFNNCKEATSLSIGTGLEYIGDSAFQDCVKLAGDVDFKNVKNIYTEAFTKSSIGEITLTGIEGVGARAFKECKGLNGSLAFPDSLVSLGEEAFFDCVNLNGDLVLGDGLTQVNKNTFKNTSFEGGLTLGQSITNIYREAFSSAGFTNQLVIPDSVSSIQYRAFYDCGFTGDLVLHSGINEIKGRAFELDRNIKRVIVDFGPSKFIDSDHFLEVGQDVGGGYLYAGERDYYDYINSPSTLSNGLFNGIAVKRGASESRVYNASDDSIIKSEEYDIPASWYDSVDSNGNGNPDVYVDIGFGVSEIGLGAFKDNQELIGNIFIPSNVVEIKGEAFLNCSSLTGGLYIEEGLQEIGEEAFEGCHGFTGDLILPDSLTGIGNYSFQKCSGFNGSLKLGAGLSDLKNYSFRDCYNLTGSLNIPSGVERVGGGAFQRCSGFNNLNIQDGIESIENSAFAFCTNFSNYITIPNTTETIGNYAFRGCKSVIGFDLGNTVKSLGSNAFMDCSGIDTITLKNNITGVGDSCFKNCSNVQYAYIDVPTGAIGNRDSLRFVDDGSVSDRILFVSEQYYNDYLVASQTSLSELVPVQGYFQGNLISIWPEDERSTTYYDGSFNVVDDILGNVPVDWKQDDTNGSYLYIGNKTNIIGQRAFRNSNEDVSNLSGTLLLPSNLNRIDSEAFTRTRFSSLASQEGIARIERQAFKHSDELKVVTLPASLEFVGDMCFQQSDNLEKLNIGKNEPRVRKTSIDEKAFYLCGKDSPKQGVVNLGYSVDVAGNNCFADDLGLDACNWIETVNSSARQLNEKAFSRQNNLKNLNLTRDSLVFYDYCFEYCTGLTNVVIPDPDRIYQYAFQYCNNITGIELGLTREEYGGEMALNGNLFKDSFRRIGTDSTNGTLKVKTSIAMIHEQAFLGDAGYRWIKSADLDCSRIGKNAFKGQINMTGVTFGDEVSHIGDGATVGMSFESCIGLKQITIPDPKNIWHYSFNSCTGITGVSIGNDEKNTQGSIQRDAFRRVGPANNSSTVGSYDLYVGSSIGFIGYEAFLATNDGQNYRYSNIKKAEINAKWIYKNAFYRQRNMTGITFGDTVKTIGKDIDEGESFRGCEKLEQITIPDPENIWYYSFNYCAGLTGISIGNDEKDTQGRIETSAFRRVGPPAPAVGVIDLYVGSSIDYIGESAFNANNDGDVDKYRTIKKATINARQIDKHAFYNQKNITGITFGDTVKIIGKDIDEGESFYACQKLKQITIPDPEAIYWYSFNYSTGITGISIGNDDKSTQGVIGKEAFRRVGPVNPSVGVIDLYVGSSIDSIGSNAFDAYHNSDNKARYRGIKSADLKCREISKSAFVRQQNLTGVTFSSGVKVIGKDIDEGTSFYDCALTEVKIPDPENIWYYSFDYCDLITGVYVGNDTEDTQGVLNNKSFRRLGTTAQGDAGNGHLYIGSSIKRLGNEAFYGDRYWIYSADINCEEIGYQCFENQRNLKELTFSSGVKTIGGRAFYNNYDLTGIRLPDPAYIEAYAFQYTQNLSGVYIGNETENTQGVVADNGGRYIGSNQLNKGYLYVGSSIKSIGTYAFYGDYQWLKKANINCESIGFQAFYNQDNLTGVTFGSGVKIIGNQAFNECDGITGLRIPDPTYISYLAFDQCRNLTGLYIGNNTEDTQGVVGNDGGRYIGANKIGQGYLSIGSSIDMIGTGAFYGDYQWLKKADLNCRIVGVRAFYNQDNLTEINLSSGVKQVKFEAFQECDGLTEVKIPDPWFVGSEVFENARNITGLYIGNDTKNTRGKIKDNFGRYMSSSKINQGYLYVGSSIKNVESQAFYGDYQWITGVDINAQNIGYRAFYSQNNIREVNFGENVKTIEERAFQECNNLSNVVVPDPTYIGYLSFDNVDGLTGVYIGNDTENTKGLIGQEAFNFCGQGTAGLGHVYIGSSIETVHSDKAFKSHYTNSKWIKSIDVNCKILGNDTSSNYGVGYGVFHGQGNLTDVKISSGVKTIGIQTFDECTGITGLRIPDPENVYLNACRRCGNITGLYVGNDEKDPYAILKDQSFHALGENQLGQGHIYLGRSIKYVGFSAVGGYYQESTSILDFESWSASTDIYYVGDKVLYNNNVYECIQQHDPKFYFTRYPDKNPHLWNLKTFVPSIGYYGYPWLKTADLKCQEFGERAFLHQDNLTGITFSEDCRTFGYRSFDHCIKNIEVKIPGRNGGDVNIGELAFSRNYDLEEVQIGVSQGFDGGSVITKDAFRDCGRDKLGLGYVNIHRSVAKVEEYAFYGDYNWIQEAVINCSGVAPYSFAEQQNLNNLEFVYGVREVSGYAFQNCTALTGPIRFRGSNVNNIEENAFIGCPVGDVYFDTNQSSVNIGAFPDMQANAKFYVTAGKIGTWGSTFNGHQVVEWTTYPNVV